MEGTENSHEKINNLNETTYYENDAVEYQLSVDRDDMLTPDISRVLVIYTGGTIGMKNTSNGYVPVPNFLAHTLSQMSRFHDPEGLSIFGHRSRCSSSTDLQELNQISVPTPIGLNKVRLPRKPDFHSLEDGEGREFRIPSLITPPSLFGKRIRYSILEYEPLLDSSNMTMSDWKRIATDIEDNYTLFDAFIILHGTDTMAYTASALSFMLEELGKTVILTGSQVPISEVRNDGLENLLGALTIAGHFVIPEVTLYFSNKLFRGNRVTKVSAVDLDAFDSHNLRPLVNVGINFDVAWSEVLRPSTIAKFRAHKEMNPNVATLRLFPGITESTVRAFLAPPIEGVVLETYGAGNAPNAREDLVRALKEANERGVVIVNCTQCNKGLVSDLYATGKVLYKAGVVPGSDMTAECALTKLSYLLGKKYSPEKIRNLMTKNLRGELTVVATRQRFSYHNRPHHLVRAIVAAASADLHREAIENGSADVARMVMSVQERVLLEKSLYAVLLCSAAASNDLEALRSLRDASTGTLQMTIADYDGRTPLHVACSDGHISIVEFLLLNGASVHVRDRFNHTPLFDAVRSGNLAVVRLLRKAGAHFSDFELQEMTWFFFNAVLAGDLETVQLIIEAGFDINSKSSIDGRTALHIAAAESCLEIVEYLLSFSHIKPGILDRWDRTPLDEARRVQSLHDTDNIQAIIEMLCKAQ
ncbi:uncharacterized protein VTP21DRAFT_518 [Calcarisporiella thermophila]|uniref:uncharacterized protein n=1 Tax=Calcarisporiella thermophila TaxID=911321 RepID=UPI00374286E2